MHKALRIPTAVTLLFVVIWPALAEELPKQGTFTVTFAMHGSVKAIQVGEDVWAWSSKSRISTINDAGKGVLHNMSADCVSMGTSPKSAGYCTFVDGDDDKIFERWEYISAKSGGTGGLLGGTGKYAGIEGNLEFTWTELPAPDGNFQGHGKLMGSYKLP